MAVSIVFNQMLIRELSMSLKYVKTEISRCLVLLLFAGEHIDFIYQGKSSSATKKTYFYR